MKKPYLLVENYNGYDQYYIPFKDNKTWRPILAALEDVLEEKYLENGSQIDGITLRASIVLEDSENLEIDE